jgi:hypothetical protein
LEIVRHLNERYLLWLAHIATADREHALAIFRQNRDLWKILDARACSRGARTPIVLLNCNFQYADWWASVASHNVPPVRYKGNDGSSIAEDAQQVLREVLTEARTIAVSEPGVANLVLGAPSPAVRLIASLTLSDVDWIAGKYAQELRPRWAEKSVFWRNLLVSSLGDTDQGLSELYRHGLQLVGSDLLEFFGPRIHGT